MVHIYCLFLFTEDPFIRSISLFRSVGYGVTYTITSGLLVVEHGSGRRLRSSCVAGIAGVITGGTPDGQGGLCVNGGMNGVNGSS